MNSVYPKIAEKISFIRADGDGKTYEGEGIVRAIYIDPNLRVMVQVAEVTDPSKVFGVDLTMVNPSEENKAAYRDLIAEVQALTNEGNDIVRKTIEDYNGRVQSAYDRVLGAGITLPTSEPVNENAAEAA